MSSRKEAFSTLIRASTEENSYRHLRLGAARSLLALDTDTDTDEERRRTDRVHLSSDMFEPLDLLGVGDDTDTDTINNAGLPEGNDADTDKHDDVSTSSGGKDESITIDQLQEDLQDVVQEDSSDSSGNVFQDKQLVTLEQQQPSDASGGNADATARNPRANSGGKDESITIGQLQEDLQDVVQEDSSDSSGNVFQDKQLVTLEQQQPSDASGGNADATARNPRANSGGKDESITIGQLQEDLQDVVQEDSSDSSGNVFQDKQLVTLEQQQPSDASGGNADATARANIPIINSLTSSSQNKALADANNGGGGMPNYALGLIGAACLIVAIAAAAIHVLQSRAVNKRRKKSGNKSVNHDKMFVYDGGAIGDDKGDEGVEVVEVDDESSDDSNDGDANDDASSVSSISMGTFLAGRDRI